MADKDKETQETSNITTGLDRPDLENMEERDIKEYEGDVLNAILGMASFKHDESEFRRIKIVRNKTVMLQFMILSLGTGKEGQEDANVISISAPPAEKASGGNVKQDFKIDIGGMNLTVEVNGGEGGEINQDAIVNAIRENFTKLADEVAGHIAEKVGDIWENQPVSTAI